MDDANTDGGTAPHESKLVDVVQANSTNLLQQLYRNPNSTDQ